MGKTSNAVAAAKFSWFVPIGKVGPTTQLLPLDQPRLGAAATAAIAMGGVVAATIASWPVTTVRLRQVRLRGFGSEHEGTSCRNNSGGQSVENRATHDASFKRRQT
jgi:hypothetical protein